MWSDSLRSYRLGVSGWMQLFNAYVYNTDKFGTTLFIFKRVPQEKLPKLFPASHPVSLVKLYYCTFVTDTDIYIVQTDDADINLILESIFESTVFDPIVSSLYMKDELCDRFTTYYNRIKEL